jgi:AbrB family looped-hinge helix DNA binding protein
MKSEGSFTLNGLVRVNKRGQVVLPKEVRNKAGIKAGDKLLILACEDNGKFFIIVKAANLHLGG